MKTLHVCLQGLLLLWVSNFLSGCLIHYHYQSKVIEVQLRGKDDPTKIWFTIDNVVKALDYQLHNEANSPHLDVARAYMRPRFGDKSEIHVEFDKTSRIFRIKKVKTWLGSNPSNVDIDSRLEGLRTLLAQALPGTTVVIVTVREE